MNTFGRLVLAWLSGLGIWLWPLLLSATGDANLTEVMRALAAVPTVAAEFREEKTLAILDTPLIATGRLYYRAPDFLRKQTLHPQTEDYEADGHWLTIETAATGRRQFDLNGYPQLRPLVEAIRATQAGDQATLERYYQLELHGTLPDWTLRLSPKDETARRYISAIVLHGQGGRIIRMETLEANGDHSVMTITLMALMPR